MANKKSKKSQQKSAQSAAASSSSSKAAAKKTIAKKDAAPAKKAAKPKKNAKPGLLARAKAYIGSIRSEMRRVVWPSKQELISYSVTVCVSLVVVGVAIALLDFVIGEGLVLFSSLRG